ncbi:hypothetical protein SERLA73DRAFT_191456 [Serpula lacrymans var. lacrymans S7.3]|uniref:Secreted protein n=1 Tax=Serpula lacrymans var. lacrymans (strain S7.3) TaxID=936435 RepID=F8QHM5_SERL3|nr:hypothetical protein SERLA73DRAFT_191456 [Serpula lacrymans var. lacrymans S7.3]
MTSTGSVSSLIFICSLSFGSVFGGKHCARYHLQSLLSYSGEHGKKAARVMLAFRMSTGDSTCAIAVGISSGWPGYH